MDGEQSQPTLTVTMKRHKRTSLMTSLRFGLEKSRDFYALGSRIKISIKPNVGDFSILPAFHDDLINGNMTFVTLVPLHDRFVKTQRRSLLLDHRRPSLIFLCHDRPLL